MQSEEIETDTLPKAEIINRGRGPEIKGTRITVYSILDYILECWHRDQIAVWFGLSSDQVQAAIEYIWEHKIEVLTDYVKILERSARGNPPEIQAKVDANHARFQELKKQLHELKERQDAEVRELIRRHREEGAREREHAGTHGG